MAAIVPVNALTSRLILGETLELVDIQGGIFIFAGIGIVSYGADRCVPRPNPTQQQRTGPTPSPLP